jgi:hypothetical protein
MLEDLGRLRKSFEDMDGFEFSRVVCVSATYAASWHL